MLAPDGEARRISLAGREEAERFLGMISVADLLQVIASDHKARADKFEAFASPQR